MHGLPLGSGGSPRAELVVWADNVDAVYVLLLEKGVPGVSALHDFLSSLRAAWVMDPDGNPVEIVSRRAVQQEPTPANRLICLRRSNLPNGNTNASTYASRRLALLVG